MHSLVNAPVLGFDLVRMPGGAASADILLWALGLGPADLDRAALAVARCAPPAREPSLTGADHLDELAELTLQQVVGLPLPVDTGVFAHLQTLLSRVSVGSLDALLRCVRDDVFGWAWESTSEPAADSPDPAPTAAPTRPLARPAAAAVVVDAVCAALREAYLDVGDGLATRTWRAAAATAPGCPPGLGPQEPALRHLLAAVRQRDPDDLARRTPLLVGPSWATAVHECTWAAHLAGRLRPAGAAQLHLVRALQQAGVPAEASAAGTWNALAGAVAALVVADVAPDATLDALVAPCLDLLPAV